MMIFIGYLNADENHRNAENMSNFLWNKLRISVTVLVILFCSDNFHCSTYLNPNSRHLSKESIDGVPIDGSIDRSTEFTYQYIVTNHDKNVRIETQVELNHEATADFPVTFQMRQRKRSESWQLPIESQSSTGRIHTRISKTLCASFFDFYNLTGDLQDRNNLITLTVSTLSPITISFTIILQYEEQQQLGLNGAPVRLEVAPMSPRLLHFTFPSKNMIPADSVSVQLFSKDLGCITVSIQNISCPVLDQENNVRNRNDGYWQTMNTTSTITVQRDFYPSGFFIVLVMHDNHSICDQGEPRRPIYFWSANAYPSSIQKLGEPQWYEKKVVQVMVSNSFSQDSYLNALVIPLFLIFLLYFGSFLCFVLCKLSNSSKSQMQVEFPPNNNRENSLQLSETQSGTTSDELCRSHNLSLSGFSSKNDAQIKKSSRVYLHIVIIVGVLYVIPGAQLVSIYYGVFHETGNQDICYYNFRCARPYGFLHDFNHVYSNVGYVLLGILAMINVRWREGMQIQSEGYGIPPHFGILYALSFSIIVGGFLSALYHVCPGRSNFHHDTCFMFIAILLTILKLYQARHPDTNASGSTAFFCLILVIVLDVVAEIADHFYFWMGFIVLYIICSLLLATQIFYCGNLKMNYKIFWRVWLTLTNDNEADPEKLKTPYSLAIFIRLGLLTNFLFAIGGGILRLSSFGFYLLIIFTLNMIMYIIYYLIMKIINKESTSIGNKLLFTLAVATWGTGVFFFVQLKSNWEFSPATSRAINDHCMILDFFDQHDTWHFLSSFGLFFTLMGLLTMDDDLKNTPRSEIAVF